MLHTHFWRWQSAPAITSDSVVLMGHWHEATDGPAGTAEGSFAGFFRWHMAGRALLCIAPSLPPPSWGNVVPCSSGGGMPVGEASRPPCLPLGDQFPMDAGPPVWPSTMSGELAVSMLNCDFLRRRSWSWRKIYLALGLKKQLKILLYSGFVKSHKSR